MKFGQFMTYSKRIFTSKKKKKKKQDFHDNSVHMYILRLRNYSVEIFIINNNNNKIMSSKNSTKNAA